MKPLAIKAHSNFIGRVRELDALKKIGQSKESSIIVMYGRRRIGKTELLEQAFKVRNVLKFEGIEGLSSHEQFGSDSLSNATAESIIPSSPSVWDFPPYAINVARFLAARPMLKALAIK